MILSDRRFIRPYVSGAKLTEDFLLEFLWRGSHRAQSAECEVDWKQRIIIGISAGDQI
jgi:hypothetical protein